jgi:hypothetical protein
MGLLRTVLAYLLVPLICPLAQVLVTAFHRGGLPPSFAVRNAFRYLGVIAYVMTAVFGVPAFLLLRHSRLGGKLAAAVCGGLIALAAAVTLFELVPFFFTVNNVEGYITWALTGAVSGLAFWLIAGGGKSKPGDG